MNELNYEQDLAIDPMMLDEECMKQPGLYMRYAEALAVAQLELTRAKNNLDVVKAEVGRDIRATPKDYDLVEKPTVSAVDGAILLHGQVITAQTRLEEITHQVNILRSAVSAFDHRKKSLEGLVTLFVAQYYAGPKQPRELEPGKRIVEMIGEKVSETQRKKLNAKKKDEEKPRSRRVRK